jgi:hypothetical protein
MHLHCCQHIADNLQRFGNKVRPLFWAAAYAKTPEAFAEKIELIQLENESAYSYLLAICCVVSVERPVHRFPLI